MEIEKTKPTFIISVLKVEYYLGGLSFFDFQLFSNKISHANKWMRKKIPTCSNSALPEPLCLCIGRVDQLSKIRKHLLKIWQPFVYFNKCISNETMTNRCRMLDVTPRIFFSLRKKWLKYDNSVES